MKGLGPPHSSFPRPTPFLAAGIGVAYVTSLMACQAANVRPGDRVAVLGASGGAGQGQRQHRSGSIMNEHVHPDPLPF